jgi:hypothetical protein
MATTTKKDTPINRSNVQMFRGQLQAAMNKVLEDHGMKAAIGNIRFTAADFRFKVDVVKVSPNNKTTTEVKVGQLWQFGAKTYTIESINGDQLIGTRPSRGRAAYFNGGLGRFRIDRIKLLAGGTLVRDVT